MLPLDTIRTVKRRWAKMTIVKHTDFDTSEVITSNPPMKMPEKVTSIFVSHDGGRLAILINGKVAYETSIGTRDCAITITSEE